MDEESSLPHSLMVAGGLIGLAPALLLNLFAFLTAGAGHGWSTPLGPSFAALVAFPALGVLVSVPPSKEKFPWSLGFLVVMFGADLYLYSGTLAEGANYFWVAVTAVSPAVVAWLVLWVGAQIIATVGCVRACLAFFLKPLK